MESRAEMLERHARELAELDSRWWEEWFTEDPLLLYENDRVRTAKQFIHTIIPTIIRKREIMVEIRAGETKGYLAHVTCLDGHCYRIEHALAEVLAGRTLAPGERVEI